MQFILQYLAIIIVNVVINPWIAIPATLLTGLLYLARALYINTGRSFRRLEAMSTFSLEILLQQSILKLKLTLLYLNIRSGRSPVFSHVNATLQGSSTVRAFNATKFLEAEFHEHQNYNTSCWYLSNASSLCFTLWLDTLSQVFNIIVTYSFLLLPHCKWSF